MFALDESRCLNLKPSIRMPIPVFPPAFSNPTLGVINLQGWVLVQWPLPSYPPISCLCFPLAKPNQKPFGKEGKDILPMVVNPRVKDKIIERTGKWSGSVLEHMGIKVAQMILMFTTC